MKRFRAAMPHDLDGFKPHKSDVPAYIEEVEYLRGALAELEAAARAWIEAPWPADGALDGPWWDARERVAGLIPLRPLAGASKTTARRSAVGLDRAAPGPSGPGERGGAA